MSERPQAGGLGPAIGDVTGRARRLERVVELWYDLPLESPWTPIGGGWETPQYRYSHGNVELRGGVEGGAAGDHIAQLPLGHRPEKSSRIVVADGDGAAVLQFDPDGWITYVGAV